MIEGPMLGSKESESMPPPLTISKPGGIHTDDRGAYRISGLAKGKYRVQVDVMSGGGQAGFLTVYFPGSLKESEAKLISVDDGEELTDIDVNVPFGSLRSIGGVILLNGNPLAGAAVTIYTGHMSFDIQSSSDGTWSAGMLEPGNYSIEAKYSTIDSNGRHLGLKRKIAVIVSTADVLDADIELSGSSGTK